MRLLIMGAGSIGTAVGGFMAKAGHDVTLIGRKPYMDAIAGGGLHLSGIWGDHHVNGISTATQASEVGSDEFDLIILSVKSYDTEQAMAGIRHLIAKNTMVCSYQNGLGNAEIIAEAVGWERCIGAQVIFGVTRPDYARAHVGVIAHPTALCAYDPSTPVERIRDIVKSLDDAGLPTSLAANGPTALWMKVAYNSSLNPLSALLNVPYGALLKSEDTRVLMRQTIHELYAVAAAKNIPLDPVRPDDYATHLFEVLIPPTAEHYASMCEDLRNGRRTEIDALNGAIYRYGLEHDIACPTHQTLAHLVRAHLPLPRKK